MVKIELTKLTNDEIYELLSANDYAIMREIIEAEIKYNNNLTSLLNEQTLKTYIANKRIPLESYLPKIFIKDKGLKDRKIVAEFRDIIREDFTNIPTAHTAYRVVVDEE